MDAITRREMYLAKMCGDDVIIPAPVTRSDMYFAALCGETVDVPTPITREEYYLAGLLHLVDSIPAPITRIEWYMAKAFGFDTPQFAPITREEMYWDRYTSVHDPLIADDWATIIANIEGGTMPYRLGDYKPLDLGAQGIVNMQIVAFDADELADGSGYAPTSWLAMQALATAHRFNSGRSGEAGNYVVGTGTIGGWGECAQRAYLIDTVLPLIPFASDLLEVKKYSRIYNSAGTAVNNDETTDKIFVPSAYELGLEGNFETKGALYTVSSLKKHIAGSEDFAAWNTRTATTTQNVRYITTAGSAANVSAATASLRPVIGFCL